MANFSLLPEDVLINIFSKLPIKYVFRSRSVCKTWNFLLRSYIFSSYYNNHQLCRYERFANDGVSSFIVLEYVENNSFIKRFSENNCDYDLYDPYINNHAYLNHYLEDNVDAEYESYDPAHILLTFVTLKEMNNEFITTVDRVEKLDILFTSLHDRVAARHTRFSNVYDGIICLENEIGIILYNPYTKESQRLPFRPCTYSDYYHIILGLWFESNQPKIVKHYKVFSLLVLVNGMDPHTFVIEKYDSIENTWTEIKTMPNQKYKFCRDNCLLFNGIIHVYDDDCSDSLITLDVRSEMFGLLPLPSEIPEWNNIKRIPPRFCMIGRSRIIESCFVPHIFVLGRSLAIFAKTNDSVSSIDIWMMVEYGVKESWTKQYTINEEYITLDDFYKAPSNLTFNKFYGVCPYSFQVWWRLLLKCINDDKMILEMRNKNSVELNYFGDRRSKLVSFNFLSNKLSKIDISVTGNLLSVIPCIETIFYLK